MHLYWMNFLPLEWLIRATSGCTVVERKVKLTQWNGWTRLRNLSTMHSLDHPMRAWSAHATDIETLFMRTRGRWHYTVASLVSWQAIRCGRITVKQSIRELHQWLKSRMIWAVMIGWMRCLMLYGRSLKHNQRILLHRRCQSFLTCLKL
jgi:hypothetical protein